MKVIPIRNRKKLITIVISLILSISIIAGVITVIYQSQTVNVHNKNEVIKVAKELYADGKIDDAHYQLGLYLNNDPNDKDVNMLLGDWFKAEGNDSSAFDCYNKVAKSLEYNENSLNTVSNSKIINNNANLKFTIKPSAKHTSNMTLTVSDNTFVVNTEPETGKIAGTSSQLEENKNFLTTRWFNINSSAKSMNITGKVNCAIWQFVCADGTIKNQDDKEILNSLDSIRLDNKSVSTVAIPEDAVKARVTYYDKSIKNTAQNGKEVFVQYSGVPTGYNSLIHTTFKIPNLTENQYIEYSNGKWILHSHNKTEHLNLGKIPSNASYFNINGTLCGQVDFLSDIQKTEKQPDKSKAYGVRYKIDSTSFLCKRLGDAVGMDFDYTIDNEWVNNGNDFDNAYPWSDMKLCNVNKDDYGNTNVTYSDSPDFKLDGSNGNVMVEIPKFYSMRVVQNGFEYLWISGEEHEGYTVDPAFIASDNRRLDHIYVAAYNSTNDDDKLVSRSNSYPAVKLSIDDMKNSTANNGNGFAELDYLTYNALQRLFIIETGNTNSGSIFEGVSGDYYFYKDKDLSAFAVSDSKNSNTIILKANKDTNRLAEGDSIALLGDWDEYENSDYYHREIKSIAQNTDETLEITFSGKPINIVANKTAITNIPTKSGKTDEIKYCTGVENNKVGKASFKYRGIENLYGNLCVILDNAYAVGDSFTYQNAVGQTFSVSTPLAIQPQHISEFTNSKDKKYVKSMIFDEYNPLVMLPGTLGSGASQHSAYGDYWLLSNQYSRRYLAVGGADDNFGLSGLFHMRAFVSLKGEGAPYIGSRMMYRE